MIIIGTQCCIQHIIFIYWSRVVEKPPTWKNCTDTCSNDDKPAAHQPKAKISTFHEKRPRLIYSSVCQTHTYKHKRAPPIKWLAIVLWPGSIGRFDFLGFYTFQLNIRIVCYLHAEIRPALVTFFTLSLSPLLTHDNRCVSRMHNRFCWMMIDTYNASNNKQGRQWNQARKNPLNFIYSYYFAI